MRVTFNPLKIIHLIEIKFVPHVSPWSKETCAESYPILVNKIHNSSHVSWHITNNANSLNLTALLKGALGSFHLLRRLKRAYKQ